CFGIVETVGDPLFAGRPLQCTVINAPALLRGQAAGDQRKNRDGQPQADYLSTAFHPDLLHEGRAVQIAKHDSGEARPLLPEEGWVTSKKNVPVLWRRRRGGCFKHRCSKSFVILRGGLKPPPRPLHKGCFAAFSLARGHPSFAKEGNALCLNHHGVTRNGSS